MGAISKITIKLIAYKNSLAKKRNRMPPGLDKNKMSSQINQLKSLIQKNADIDRNANWSNFVKSFDGSDKKFWKATKNLGGKGSKIPSMKINNRNITSVSDKATLFADQPIGIQ